MTIVVDDVILGNIFDVIIIFIFDIINIVGIFDLIIFEVVFWFSGNSFVGVDWFEVINIGVNVIDIIGWKVDDDFVSFVNVFVFVGVINIVLG